MTNNLTNHYYRFECAPWLKVHECISAAECEDLYADKVAKGYRHISVTRLSPQEANRALCGAWEPQQVQRALSPWLIARQACAAFIVCLLTVKAIAALIA